jgi:hypothetical protein
MATLEPTSAGVRPALARNVESSFAATELETDVATALLVALLRARGTQASVAKSDVTIAAERLDAAREALERARERAREASESAGLWGGIKSAFSGDVAALAGLVAASAAVIASGGTAAAVLAAVAAGASIGARVAEEAGLDPTACQVLAVAGAVGGVMAGNPEAMAGTAARVASVARGVQGASHALGGIAGIAEGHYRAQALAARADGERAAFERDAIALDMEEAIRTLERAIRDAQRLRGALSDEVRANGELSLAVISRIGAA